MERRDFIKVAAIAGAATAASTLAAPAIASGKRELKMVMTWPKNSPGLGTSA
jgi:TRAP-type mannitol/chloroaromatic compound transport system substrate-binding protein